MLIVYMMVLPSFLLKSLNTQHTCACRVVPYDDIRDRCGLKTREIYRTNITAKLIDHRLHRW